jgi:adenylate kinase family enzyme
MFYGIINEGYVFDNNDIEYNVEEFKQGKIKSLFITGHSGSGKSTLAHEYEKELGIKCYELDDIIYNFTLTNEQLKKYYGPELYEWIMGPGKQYRIDPDTTIGEWKFNIIDASADFIKYILAKNVRCIVEGIWLYLALHKGILKIEEFKNSAMIIKGTSAAKSTVRALKRDYEYDKKYNPGIKLNDSIPFNYLVKRVKCALQDENILKEMRKNIKNNNYNMNIEIS